MTPNEKIEALRTHFGENLCILAHHYQTDAIARHADRMGDSLELARQIPEIAAKILVFCGVSFMGESAALLTREGQSVYLPDPYADCMMAMMASACHVDNVLKELNTGKNKVLPLAYVNTSVSLKALVGRHGGSVCTSANAKTMLSWALSQADRVLFLPDKNLGANTARALGLDEKEIGILRLSGYGLSDSPESFSKKRLLLWPGCCPIHSATSDELIRTKRAEYPNCHIYVHPECPPGVVEASDGSGSTSFLIKKAAEFAEKEKFPLIIGTENNLVRRLQKRHGKCTIIPLFEGICPDMMSVTEQKLLSLLENLKNGSPEPVHVCSEEKEAAREALTRMLTICEQ